MTQHTANNLLQTQHPNTHQRLQNLCRSTFYKKFLNSEIQTDPVWLQMVPQLKTSQSLSTSFCNPMMQEYHHLFEA